ncbi:MAG: hypothetical protein R3F17_03065 [Planctomycetota bacterium]
MAVTAGVIFTAPLIQVLYADKGLPVPPVDVKTLIYVSIAGALIGYGFVGLTTKSSSPIRACRRPRPGLASR